MGVVKLGDVARESRLKWTKSKQDVPIVGLEHLIPDEIRFDAYDINTDNTFSKRFVKGQVLFGRRRAYQRKAAIAEFDGICSGDITVIEAIEGKMVPELLPFIIQTPVFFDYANRGSAGSLSPRVKWEHLADYEFELPPLEEQKILADKLWAAYRLKEAYKKLLDATDEMVKSQFIEMVGDPRNNPKGWPTKRLSELAEYSIGLTYKPEQICDDGTIVLRSGNIQDGKISFSDIVRVNAPIKESLFVKEDDILMCSRNGSASLVGKVAMIPDINEPMTFGAFMTIIRSAEAKYLYLYFQSQDFRERVSEGKSSTMNQITQKMLDKVEVPFPDKDVRETLSAIASQADKSKFGDFKSQFIEMFGDTHMRSDHSRQWKEVVEIINGKDYKSIQVEDGGYPVYGTGGEMARASDYLSPANSILLGRKGTIDKPLLIREKYWNVDTAFGAVPDEKVLHYVYFYWHCKTIDFNVLNKGTTLPSTTKVDLLNLWIKIPSMEEQTRFGSIVEQADKSKSVIQKALVYLNDIQSDELRKIA